jgi:hypothetical protein
MKSVTPLTYACCGAYELSYSIWRLRPPMWLLPSRDAVRSVMIAGAAIPPRLRGAMRTPPVPEAKSRTASQWTRRSGSIQ